MNQFKSKKAIWWSVGLSFLLVGVLVYALFAPHMVEPLGHGAPDVEVPSMRNVPANSGALLLDVPAEEGKQPPPRSE